MNITKSLVERVGGSALLESEGEKVLWKEPGWGWGLLQEVVLDGVHPTQNLQCA